METVALDDLTLKTVSELKELGYNLDAPADINAPMPPGNARWVMPHFYNFTAIYNQATRAYRYTFDEALRNSQCNALAMLRDPVIKEALKSRLVPTAQLAWHIEPFDERNPQDANAAAECERLLRRTPRFQHLRWWLLWAIWYGRSAVQVKYEWNYKIRPGKKTLAITKHRPVNGDKIVFKYNDDVGVLVHASWDGTWEPTERGRAHFLTPVERKCYVIHEFEQMDADYYEPELAGSVHGTGLRGELYWLWLMKNTYLAMLFDFMQRTAMGFTVYYYQAGNQESLEEVKAAAQSQMGNSAILFPRLNESGDRGPGVSRVEPSQGGASLFNAMKDYFDSLIRRTILMQTLTTITGASELGGDSAGALEASSGRLQKYDAACLEESLNEELLPVLYEYNWPGITPGRLTHSVDKPDAKAYMEAAQFFFGMGGTLDEDDLRSVLGLPKPEAGHAILSQAAQAQPGMLGMTPQGIPSVGDAGPVPDQGQDPNQAMVQGVE